MTTTEFKTLVDNARSEADLDRLMQFIWSDLTATLFELKHLGEHVNQRYVDLVRKDGESQCDNPVNAGQSPLVPVASGAPLSDLEVAQLVSLFDIHGGRVPVQELQAENFKVPVLVAQGYIVPSPVRLERGTFLIGEKLRAEILGPELARI